MLTWTTRALGVVVLIAGILALANSSIQSACDPDEKKATQEAQQDLIKLAEALEKGNGNGKAQAEAIHKKYDELKPVMNIFKPRDKGGIGVGPRSKGDGIELKVKDWGGRKTPTAANLKKMAGDIERAAKITRAVADVTDLYLPKKDQEEWKKYTQDMREAAEEWAKAAQSGDPAQFKKASNKLDASCTDCHGKFRD